MRRIILALFMILTTLFSGCSNIKGEPENIIVPPANNSVSIKGLWKIEKYKIVNNNYSKLKLDSIVGESAQFDEKISSIAKEVCVSPNYKVKRVDIDYYVLYKYKIDYKTLDINKKEVEVISVSSADKPFYEFIKYDEDKMLVYYEGAFLYLSKISDQGHNSNSIDISHQPEKNLGNAQSSYMKSCALIGLRSQRMVNEKGELMAPDYRTLWISADGTNLYGVHERKDLLVPRMTGFWELKSSREIRNGYINEQLIAYPYDNNINAINQSLSTNALKQNNDYNVMRNIAFVGNDYVAVEYYESNNLLPKNFNILQVLPMDNLQNSNGIKISDIAGESGKNAFINSANAFFTSNSKETVSPLEKNVREESFILTRRNGHWIIKGRINSSYKNDYSTYYDFNVNFLPPKKLVNYDELYISWNAIKWKVPDAVDAYTSPNNQIALIITKNYIYIYGIKDYELTDKPIKKIKIEEGESVVMAEWATGDFVDKWEKVFKVSSKPIEE